MLSSSFVLRQQKTNLRLTEPETIKVLEFKNDLEFEHRLRNLKLASYLTQTRNSKNMAAHVREERRRIRQLNNVRGPRLFRDRTNALEELPAEAVFERFRFSPATIMFLMTIVGEAASQTLRNCPLPPLIRLLVCLRYLVSGTIHINVGDSLGISRQAAGLAIRNMAKRIAALAGRYIRFPTGQHSMRVKDDFAAIAGKHFIHSQEK